MRFTAKLGTLQQAVASAAKGVATSGVRPALANLLISVRGDEATIYGTDLEIIMMTKIAVQSEENGAIAVPARLIQEIISSMTADKGEDVRLSREADDASLRIVCGRNKATIPTFSAEEMPPMIDMANPAPMIGLPPEFAAVMTSASISIGANNNNPATNGLLLEVEKDGQINLVSTDSRRLATASVKIDSVPAEFVGRRIIPGRAVAEIQKIMAAEIGTIVEIRDNQLVFIAPSATLVTRLIDGKFPDYRRIFPKEPTRTMCADRKAIIAALKAISPIADRSSQMVRFDIGSQETIAWAVEGDGGRAETSFPSVLVGDPINIAFNFKFMLDSLSATDADEIDLKMTEPSLPAIMEPNRDGDTFRYVIMPMTN